MTGLATHHPSRWFPTPLFNRSTVARRDRFWAGAATGTICGRIDTPSAHDLRAALATLSKLHPHSRLSWSLDASRRHWTTDVDTESLVVERDWDDNLSVGEALDAIVSDEKLRTPLALIRYPNYLGLKIDHSIGDGLIYHAIYSAVLNTALSGEPYPWPTRPTGWFPMGRAVLRTFGKNPTLIKTAIADRPRKRAAVPASVELPWSASRRTLYTGIPTADWGSIAGWAKQFAPGANRFALQMSLIMRSLRRCGLQMDPFVSLVVDLRRYLGSRAIDGNFVVGVPLWIEPDIPPAKLSSSIRATLTSGRPLATQVLSTMRMGGRGESPSTVDPCGVPRLAFSALGRLPEVHKLPFAPEGPEVYTASVEPEGPLGMTILIVDTSTTTHISTTFHDNVIDTAVVSAALRLMKTEPLDVLSGSTR